VVRMEVSVTFEKVEAERLLEPAELVRLTGERIEVNTRVDSVELKQRPSRPDSNVVIKFVFTCRYPASIGLIRLTGQAFYSDAPETMKVAVETWQKSHRLPESIEPAVLNTIMGRATLEAISLSRILQIPPPIPLPGVPTNPPLRRKPGKADFSHYV
jgi:hypothetical protein